MAQHKLIGEILLEQGLCNRQQVASAMIEAQRKGLSLGQILIERGDVTPEQLESALAEQEEEDLSILPGYSVTLFGARPGERDEFVQFLQFLRPKTILGLVDTVDLLSEDNPNLIATFSEWESPRACRDYFNSSSLLEMEGAVAPLLTARVERHQFRSIGDFRRGATPARLFFMVLSRIQRHAITTAETRTAFLENALTRNGALLGMRSGSAMDDPLLAVDLFEWASVEAFRSHRNVRGAAAPETVAQPWREGMPLTFVGEITET